jgi:hypothetical protein
MRKFQRTIEDFVCGNCGHLVVGNGFTNHCPLCLWSKHVDVMPGDRANPCGGMMRPVQVTPKQDGYVITTQCLRCGHVHRNRSAPQDSQDALLTVAKHYAERTSGR